MEDVIGTSKEYVFEKLINFLRNEKEQLKFTAKASMEIDLDPSWTRKALIMGVIIHASINGQLYCEKSKVRGRDDDIIYIIKPIINDKPRWVRFRLGQDESGEDTTAVIISAHEDR